MAMHVDDDQAPWMAIPKIQFTPIRAPSGKVVHAVSLSTAGTTACGKKAHRWVIALSTLDCKDCKLALHKDARARTAG